MICAEMSCSLGGAWQSQRKTSELTVKSLQYRVPPLWSSGQSSWLQIQRSGFDSWRNQIFWEVVGLEQGPLSLMSTTKELLGRKSSGYGLENREYACRDPSCWPCDILYPQKLPQTLLTNSGHSVGIVRSQTKATELLMVLFQHHVLHFGLINGLMDKQELDL
jgi:hypothetical protein